MPEAQVEIEYEADEEKFERMLELEERLVKERMEREHDTVEDAVDVEQEDEDVRGDRAAGVIRAIEEDGNRVRVEFFVEGAEVEEDTLELPGDAADPDEELNRLCRLCGVEFGRVSQLQGETVPVVWNDLTEEYELHLPTTASQPGLSVYRAWWWLRRRELNTKRMRQGVGIGIGAVAALAGLRVLYAMFSSTLGPDSTVAELTAYTLPLLSAGGVESMGTAATALLTVTGSVLLLLASAVGAALVVGIAAVIFIAFLVMYEWVEQNAWPF